MRTVVLVLMLTAVIVPTSGSADPSPKNDAAGMIADDCARARKARKTCVLDVAPEEVNGQTPAAGEVGARIAIFGGAGSLLRLRRDFIPEIVKTAEDLAPDR